MKHFFLAFSLMILTTNSMEHNGINQSANSFVSVKRIPGLRAKYKRVPINHDNDKTRKWAGICPKCGEAKNDVPRHMRAMHTNEYPYECLYCKEKFSESCACVIHITIHHSTEKAPKYMVKFPGEEPYELPAKKRKLRRKEAKNEDQSELSPVSPSAENKFENLFSAEDWEEFEKIYSGAELPLLEETPVS